MADGTGGKKPPPIRLVIRAAGIVQGVGFRPFVHALASRYGLRGYVLNDTTGVMIEAEGPTEETEHFLAALRTELPPAARIFRLEVSRQAPAGYPAFEIRRSATGDARDVPVSPDLATCEDCLREFLDPADRRHRYPFINCTQCGPRFTICRDVPYDRPRTTMASFTMCPSCRAEYEDPLNRRFHAQPNACPACGPHLALRDRTGAALPAEDLLQAAATLLREGRILAVKGLGGYHLACDAFNARAVTELRRRKHRRDEPFALMVRDLEAARRLAFVNETEAALLEGPARPIVLLRRREETPIASDVAPRQRYLGIMLPYTPLHHLLLRDSALVLVMTSGNVHDEPIAFRDDDAQQRLGGLADAFLTHNREIHIRCDDSVARVVGDHPVMVRRSRGFAPAPLHLPFEFARPVLATGALLKNTFCLGWKDLAYLSHHIGDLENLQTLEAFEQGIDHFTRFFDIRPRVVAHDLHPDYLSTRYALSLAGLEKVGVQHHHAHVAACMAENGLEEPVLGVAFDGTGYGPDGTLWGGEFLVVGPGLFERCGHLKEILLPGGDAAVREPWRVAVSHLETAFGGQPPDLPFLEDVDPTALDLVCIMIRKEVQSPLTSSMGRLFDAVAALTGIRTRITYEAQAAIELEMAADESEEEDYPFDLLDGLVVDPAETVRAAALDVLKGLSPAVIAGRFHNTVARMVRTAAERIRRGRGLGKVALTGGVFQNTLLLRKTANVLEAGGFEVFTHHEVPTNDGGLSLGQAVVANWRERCASPYR